MAEDEKAEEALHEALQRVARMPWPKIRDRILWGTLVSLCAYFKLEIVKTESPDKLAGGDAPQPPAKE